MAGSIFNICIYFLLRNVRVFFLLFFFFVEDSLDIRDASCKSEIEIVIRTKSDIRVSPSWQLRVHVVGLVLFPHERIFVGSCAEYNCYLLRMILLFFNADFSHGNLRDAFGIKNG